MKQEAIRRLWEKREYPKMFRSSRQEKEEEGALGRKFHHLPPALLLRALISYFQRLGC